MKVITLNRCYLENSRSWRGVLDTTLWPILFGCFLQTLYFICTGRGEDFRPEYKEVLVLRSIIESPIMALTATSDEKMRQDIFKGLDMTESSTNVVAVVPDRFVFLKYTMPSLWVIILILIFNGKVDQVCGQFH